MNKFLIKSIVLFSFLAVFPNIYGQITLKLTSFEKDTLATHDIYLAGNINGWNPSDTSYVFEQNEHGTYKLTFDPPVGPVEYKFTKGSWTSVETDEQGLDIPNRTIEYKGTPLTLDLSIEGWKDSQVQSNETSSTAADNVTLLKEDFPIPQLNRERKIWIYLPLDYDTSDKSYPVLYMHDGQNLFDASTSFLGEWEVDESLNELFGKGDEGVIVVGIENGGENRINEYTSWTHPKYGGGEGDKYVCFIVETLKPYIDAHFRTKPDRLNTGIMGSSLGGLISFYAAIKYQDVFSKAGVFSPSFWFSDEVYALAEKIGKKQDMKFYFLGGALESETLVKEIEQMATTLQQAGFDASELKVSTHADGQHTEQYWRREFARSYQWLFK